VAPARSRAPFAPSAVALAAAALVLAACGGVDEPTTNDLPAGVTSHGVTVYSATAPASGVTAAGQDLLTAGLGHDGLGSATVPTYADPLQPTALELRRNAIHSNYRAILDPTTGGGYGTFYGPRVRADGTVGTGPGMIPGREYLGSLDDGTGRNRTTMAVLIPDAFDTANPCLVLGPSSGSRGVYGAIGTAGEWGLKKGCAVALTDAGKGMGLYDPTDDTVHKVDGTRATRAAAGALVHFAAGITDAVRTAYNAAFPNRLALKQVHSQQNPEKDWGSDTLVAARYAFWVLNDRYATATEPLPYTPGNTIVIAGSVSNGGAAVLRAAELDATGLIDGVVAGEPVAEMPTQTGYGIAVGGVPVAGVGRQLADVTTLGNLYQPCAALAASAVVPEVSFFNYMGLTAMTARATARCDGLAAKGLVTGATTAARAQDALDRLRAAGWTAEHDQMHNAHYGLGNGPILSAMYPWMYGRFALGTNVCSTSFAQVDVAGSPVAVTPAAKAQSFASGNGTANGAPASVVYDNSVGGPRVWTLAVSPSTGVADFGLDNAICQRALVTGTNPATGAALTAATVPTLAQSQAVQTGIAEVRLNGNLRGKPAIVVAGRSDALVPVNANARAYVAFNRTVEPNATQLRYVEVTNAQHFDAFNALTGWDTRFVPLHVYFNRAMDAMHARLRGTGQLPPSQVVRGVPRGGLPGAAPALTATNVPAVAASPSAANAIAFSGTSIAVPQ
jgi:hydroxybutyrate-dimer hydrolase